MDNNVVIDAQNLSKTFFVNENSVFTIREAVKGLFTKTKGSRRVIKALQTINFQVKQGDFFSVIGRNGSGKSTLLNIIIGSIRADPGSILKTKGRIIRLALGMGFDPNLSARDNIYVNASILGLTFKRIGQIFDDIIGFAELEEFVDVPVKHFSSGMMSKLKFSIAIYVEADIFLMDEFFGGVGDESFRKKSAEVFENTFLDGRTIMHVSHSMATVHKFSTNVLVLDKGNQIALGPPQEVIPVYRNLYSQ